MSKLIKKSIKDFGLLLVLLFCVLVGFLISFVVLDFSYLPAKAAIGGGIGGLLYYVLTHFILKIKNPPFLFKK